MKDLLTINKKIGNIYLDNDINKKIQKHASLNSLEEVVIHRSDSEKIRMRRTTNKGTDIAITLEPGSYLRDGDVLFVDNDKAIIIKLAPEDVAILSFDKSSSVPKNEDYLELGLKIGHVIGNLHRPLKFQDSKVIIPIHSPDEINLLKKLLLSLMQYVTITYDKIVFEPDSGFDVHEH